MVVIITGIWYHHYRQTLKRKKIPLISYLVLLTVMIIFLLRTLFQMNTYLQFQLIPLGMQMSLSTWLLLTHLSKIEKNKIIQQSARYCWIGGHLFYTGPDLEIKICVREDEVFSILKACHDEPCGGHFADKQTCHKVLRMG